jgi:four helix bundle protein
MGPDELRARTREFALEVIDVCVKLAGDDLGTLIRSQLIRSATGVAANYRAACRSRSHREFAARLAIVVEEADESELWLDILIARQFKFPSLPVLRREAIELRAIFSASRATVLKRLGQSRSL